MIRLIENLKREKEAIKKSTAIAIFVCMAWLALFSPATAVLRDSLVEMFQGGNWRNSIGLVILAGPTIFWIAFYGVIAYMVIRLWRAIIRRLER